MCFIISDQPHHFFQSLLVIAIVHQLFSSCTESKACSWVVSLSLGDKLVWHLTKMNNRKKWKFSKEIKSDNAEVKLGVIRFENGDSRIKPGWDLGCTEPLNEQHWKSLINQKQGKVASILFSLSCLQNKKPLMVERENLLLLWIEDYNEKIQSV